MWRHTETQAMAGVVWRGQAKQLDWKHRTVWPLLGKRKMAGHTYIWVGLFIHCHNLPDPVTKDRHNTDVGEAMARSLSVDECWLRSGVCCIGSSSLLACLWASVILFTAARFCTIRMRLFGRARARCRVDGWLCFLVTSSARGACVWGGFVVALAIGRLWLGDVDWMEWRNLGRRRGTPYSVDLSLSLVLGSFLNSDLKFSRLNVSFDPIHSKDRNYVVTQLGNTLFIKKMS